MKTPVQRMRNSWWGRLWQGPSFLGMLVFVFLLVGCGKYQDQQSFSTTVWSDDGSGYLATWIEYESKTVFINTSTRNHRHRFMVSEKLDGPFKAVTGFIDGSPPDQLFYMKSAGYMLAVYDCDSEKKCLVRYDLATGKKQAERSFDATWGQTNCDKVEHLPSFLQAFMLAPSPDGKTLAVFRSKHQGGCPEVTDYSVSIEFRDPLTFDLLEPVQSVTIPSEARARLDLPADCGDASCSPRTIVALGAQAAWGTDNTLLVAFFKPFQLGSGSGAMLVFHNDNGDMSELGGYALAPGKAAVSVGTIAPDCLDPLTSSSPYNAQGLYVQSSGSVLTTFQEERSFGCP